MSLIINADGEYLQGTGGSFSPSSFTEMSFGVWVKRTTALSTYQGYAAIANSLAVESNAVALAHYWDKTDGFIWPGSAVRRGNGKGATESTTWQMLLFTYKQGGDVKVYTGITGGSLTNDLFDGNNTTDQFGAAFTQIRIGGGMDSMLATWNSRAKLAHCCFWTKELTAAEAGQLFNGGTAGAGKNPQAIQNANLKFYATLASDATVTVGGYSLSATGTLTYDGADNPNVEAYGSTPTLVSANAAHGHTIDNLVLTTSHALTINSALHGHAIDNINLVFAGSTTLTVANATHAHSTDNLALTIPGTLVSEPLKTNNGTLLASVALDFVAVYNDTTGALVVRQTGLSTNGSGVFSISDAALVAGTTYRVDWQTAGGQRRMPRKAAA